MPTSPRNATRVELLLALTCANLLGCAGGHRPARAPREAKAAPPTGPAFVVYTPRSTLVVPVAGGAPIAEAEGLWVLDDATTPPAVRVLLPEAPEGLAPCDGERASETSCEPMPILYVGGPVCDCLPVEPELPSEPGDALDGEPDDAEDESECASMYTAPASLVGGSLFALGSSHSMCGGMNVYDAAGAEHPMVEAPFELASFARQLEAKGCTVDVPAGEPAPVSDHDRLECASPGPGAARRRVRAVLRLRAPLARDRDVDVVARPPRARRGQHLPRRRRALGERHARRPGALPDRRGHLWTDRLVPGYRRGRGVLDRHRRQRRTHYRATAGPRASPGWPRALALRTAGARDHRRALPSRSARAARRDARWGPTQRAIGEGRERVVYGAATPRGSRGVHTSLTSPARSC